MGSRLVSVLAMVVVVAIAFIGIGVAYTASTENTNNTVSSEYVVLYQTNYTLTSGGIVIMDTYTSGAGTSYGIHGIDSSGGYVGVDKLLKLGGEVYYGL